MSGCSLTENVKEKRRREDDMAPSSSSSLSSSNTARDLWDLEPQLGREKSEYLGEEGLLD